MILQPFWQPLLDFLVSELTCKRRHLTRQVFPKSFVVLATAQTLAEGDREEEEACRFSPAAGKSRYWGLQERRFCGV